MEEFLNRFNVSDLLLKDAKEIELVKGENHLWYATLGEDRVLYREAKNETLIQGVDKEIWYFFRIQSKYLAYCLGYALVNEDYLLVFPANPFTLQDWFKNKTKVKFRKNPLGDEELQRVLNNVLQIFKFLLNVRLYLNDCALSDFFVGDQGDVQLYNLSNAQENNPDAHFFSLSKIFSVILRREIQVFSIEQGSEIIGSMGCY